VSFVPEKVFRHAHASRRRVPSKNERVDDGARRRLRTGAIESTADCGQPNLFESGRIFRLCGDFDRDGELRKTITGEIIIIFSTFILKILKNKLNKP